MADIITMLKEDHTKVKGLFERLEKSTERAIKTRVDVLAQIAADLRVHMRFEEDTFYPAVKAGADKEGRELTNEAYAEHDAASSVLEKLEAIEPSDEMWKANMMVLKENIEHHIKEEENELFKHAKAVLSKDELKAMGEQYAAMKAEPMPAPTSNETKKSASAPTPKTPAKSKGKDVDDGRMKGSADDIEDAISTPAMNP